MIILLFLLLGDPDCDIDSLEAVLAREVSLPTILALNTCYLRRDEYAKGLELMAEFETRLPPADRPVIILQRGDNYLFTGKILDARETFLGLVAEHPSTGIANDALERLYLIEKKRKDMLLLRRLTRAMGLVYTGRYGPAEDSLQALITTDVGMYAYIFLSRVYAEQNKLPLALSAFDELNANFPDHTIDRARIEHGMLYLHIGDTLHARAVFEDLILRNPLSLYADRARELLCGIPE